MINFPDAPTTNQVHNPGGAGTPSWAWDGTKWTAASGGGAAYAPLASPVFTGDARAVTPATADNDTSIATTAYVQAQGYATSAAMTTADNLRVLKAGDTMTGALAVAGNVSALNHTIVNQATGDAGIVGFTNTNGPGLIFAGTTTGNAGSLLFTNAGLETARITNAGALGINIQNPFTKFDVRGQAAAGASVAALRTGPNGADGTSTMLAFTDSAVTIAIGAITRTGTNQVAYGTSSDQRLKTNIKASERGLDEVMALKVSDYRMGESEQQGLLAQQVSEHYPEAVIEGGDDPNLQPWMLDYGRLTPLLIRAVQELTARLEALEGKPA